MKANFILDLLKSGQDIAFVSDAGTPGICDPGAHIVSYLTQNAIKVVPIPGCSSLTSFISCTGFPMDSYMFCGFVPRKKGDFKKKLELLSQLSISGVFFEAPSRILKTFYYLKQDYPKINCVVAKELTKVHEHFFRGSIEDVSIQLEVSNLKGEWLFILDFTSVLHISKPVNQDFISLCQSMNLTNQDIVRLCVEMGMKKNQVYNILIEK